MMLCDTAFLRAVAALHTTSAGDPSLSIQDAVRTARGILIVALAEIGDGVLLTPFLTGIRALAPNAHITLVCGSAAAPLFQFCPHVNEVLAYDHHAPRLLRPLVLSWRAWSFARARLRSQVFEVALVPRWDTDHRMATAVALFSGATRRVAYSERVNDRKRVLNAGFDSLVTEAVHDPDVQHEVNHHLALLRFLGDRAPSGDLAVWSTPEDSSAVDFLLDRAGVQFGSPFIALGIGAADPKRRWPPERFIELGIHLRECVGAHLIVVGGPADAGDQDIVARGVGVGITPTAGLLTLRQTAVLLTRCRLFVGNDSAPLHLAAAAGVPCVEISCHPLGGDPNHNNAPERFAPWGVPRIVLRPQHATNPCTGVCGMRVPHCILSVTTTAVKKASELLVDLERSSPKSNCLR